MLSLSQKIAQPFKYRAIGAPRRGLMDRVIAPSFRQVIIGATRTITAGSQHHAKVASVQQTLMQRLCKIDPVAIRHSAGQMNVGIKFRLKTARGYSCSHRIDPPLDVPIAALFQVEPVSSRLALI
jgi:hypothetical protein